MKAWVFGDDIDTDAIAPGRYMKLGIEEISTHCFESTVPDFSKKIKPGDFVVAGRNFGTGSSREQAPAALKHLGVAALIPESFAGLFYRNALNLGLPALVCANARRIRSGDQLEMDLERAVILNKTNGEKLECEPLPAHLVAMVLDGGLLAHLERRLK